VSSEWEPVVSVGIDLKSFLAAKPNTSPPLQMRKKKPDGGYFYREPTPQEIQEYLEAEAW